MTRDTNERTQLTKLVCENCGATLVVCGQHLLKCEYCKTTYLVSDVGRLIESLGEYDIAPREISLDDYFYSGPSHDDAWK